MYTSKITIFQRKIGYMYIIHYYMLFEDKKGKFLYRHNMYLHHDYYYYICKALHIEKYTIAITIALLGGTIMFDFAFD